MFVAIGECLAEFAPNEAGGYTLGFAGDTFNAAWAARVRLRGAVPVRYVTAIGTDWMSDAMRARIEAAGIDAAFVRRVEGASVGLYVIRVEAGERSFAYWRRHSAATHLADDPAFLARALAGARLVLVSGITLAILPPAGRAALLDVLGAARAAGAEIAFDTNYRPALWRDADEAREIVRRVLPLVDIALPTFEDEAALFGDAAPAATVARLAAAGVRDIVVKNGTAATLGRFGADSFEVVPREVVTPVDSTGAGDAFNGTFLACRMQGMAPASAVAAAQAVAARAVLTRGALIAEEA
ncbi:unnamed protein product [Acidocella sp. C78]|uniref:sugar kinase n=1 Tax=Acidocella sp. C78 TaxID=1671486 RepID=UPI00191B9404|nr:sugar kinase [Acidocella sp. C78]CAG4918847.1 unnamed protein product [Acidocella sp. C78]